MSHTKVCKTIALRMTAVLCAVAVCAAACAGSTSEQAVGENGATVAPELAPTPTDYPATPGPATPGPATPEPAPAVEPTPGLPLRESSLMDQAALAAVADGISVEDGAFLIAVLDGGGNMVQASNGVGRAGAPPTADDLFQVGSITKVFTAVATLTLVDDGLVDLDAPAADYVSRVDVQADVTVRNLLQHTSGIYSFTDSSELVAAADDAPSRSWTPEEVYEYADDRETWFEPGTRYQYSNTNYLILGLLLEEVTGQAYHEVVRDRIIDPLGLGSTYLAGFEDGPDLFDPYQVEGVTDYDETSYSTVAWSAGAMVSSASDLHEFLTALFANQVVPAELVEQMTQASEVVLGFSPYGLGLSIGGPVPGAYGHDGAYLGHLTVVRHAPESGITMFVVSADWRILAPPGPYSRIEASRSQAVYRALDDLATS